MFRFVARFRAALLVLLVVLVGVLAGSATTGGPAVVGSSPPGEQPTGLAGDDGAGDLPPRGQWTRVVSPDPGPAWYVVRADDTLWGIGLRLGRSCGQVYAANLGTVRDPHRIFPGQRLRVPSGTATSRACTAHWGGPARGARRTDRATLPTVASGSVWDRLAACESGGNWAADTGNGFYGGLQFTLSTWRSVGGVGRPDQASRAEQVLRAQLLQRRDGWGAWPACSRRLGLGRLAAPITVPATGAGGGLAGRLAALAAGVRGRALRVALAQRGDPYRWGAAGPDAFDCSGLVVYAYRLAGVTLPHSSAAQQRLARSVGLRGAVGGALLFYAGHVEVYAGTVGGVRYAVAAHTWGRPVSLGPMRTSGLLKVGRVA